MPKVKEIVPPNNVLACGYYFEGTEQEKKEFRQLLCSYYDIPPESQHIFEGGE